MTVPTKNQAQSKMTDAEAPSNSGNKPIQQSQTKANKTNAMAEQIKPVIDLPNVDLANSTAADSVKQLDSQESSNKAAKVEAEASQKISKADRAKIVYDEMVADLKNDKAAIIAKIKKDVGVSKGGASTYYYKFQRESGRVTEKGPTKMDNAKKVFENMTLDGNSRKEIIDAFIKEVGLTKAGASTYYQNLKKDSEQTTKTKTD